MIANNGKKYYVLETLIVLVFILTYCIVTSFHEPWFDEAQAWQIAKCASLHDLLFLIPHYEGHPPLWHLILAIPARLGIPFEIGLKTIGLTIATSSVALILFRSPFPKPVRLMLPFTYFVFYQYGVVVRPYGLMLLAFLLLALEFPRKDQHPWRYVAILVLLCLTSAYGLLFAAGIALCMTWELKVEKGFKRLYIEVLSDSRTRSLCVLLVVGILLALEIRPVSDTWVTTTNGTNPLFICLACTMLTLLPECVLTSSSWFRKDTYLLQTVNVPLGELAFIAAIGILLWTLLLSLSSKKLLKYLLVPYGMFAVFAAAVYLNGHHIGVILPLVLSWIWIVLEDADRFEVGRIILSKIVQTDRDAMLAKRLATVVGVVCLVVPCYWTIHAAMTDVQYDYWFGRRVSAFIEQNELKGLGVLSEWSEVNPKGLLADYEKGEDGSIIVALPVAINAYFDGNVCYNLNEGRDDEAFLYHRLTPISDTPSTLNSWRTKGKPAVLLGRPNLKRLFSGAVSYDDYTLVLEAEYYFAWKDSLDKGIVPVYVRNEIAQQLGLVALLDASALWSDGLSITPEMRERYEAGASIEDILDPYLDKMFGESDE